MKDREIIYRILKFLFDNPRKDGISLPFEILRSRNIPQLITYLLSEEYIQEGNYDDQMRDSDIPNRKFKLTNKGERYLDYIISSNDTKKSNRLNYIKTALLTSLLGGVAFDGYIDFNSLQSQKHSDHSHDEEYVRLSVNNFFTTKDSTDEINAEFNNAHSATEFLETLYKLENKQGK